VEYSCAGNCRTDRECTAYVKADVLRGRGMSMASDVVDILERDHDETRTLFEDLRSEG
jgi:hypothetical protein